MVSVVLPVYNGESFVAGAIRSIQSQSLEDWELVIADDGSTDRSLEVCRRMAAADERIRVFANETNRGLAATMNRLVKLAQGSYIAVQEQDDLSAPHRLKLEAEVLDALPEVGVVSGVANWIDKKGGSIRMFPGLLANGGQYPETKEAMVRYLYVEGCKVVNAGCMFRREVVSDQTTPFWEAACHAIDWRFFIEAAHRWRFYGLPEVVVSTRRGNGHNHLTSKKDLVFMESRQCLEDIYRQYGPRPDSPVSFRLYRAALSNELIREGRYYSGIRGLGLLSAAVVCQPGNRAAWNSLREMALRRMWTSKGGQD